MAPYFLKLARLSTIITILYISLTSFLSSIRGVHVDSFLVFSDFCWIIFLTILLSYALIDTSTLSGVVRLNIGSFTVALRRDVAKPLVLYDDEWNINCLKVREALSSLAIPVLIYPIPKISSNQSYFNNYPIESRYIADAIMLHPQLQLVVPLLFDPNTGAIIYGDGEHINNYIYSNYSKRLTDVDPPPPLTIGPLDDITSFISVQLRLKGFNRVARPSIYNKLPLHVYGNQADGPTRIVREWLCRLQLSYILFPTSRGSLYRAVLTQQVGSFYYSQRTRLVYERFNILVSYEHQRKQLLESLEDNNNDTNDSIFTNDILPLSNTNNTLSKLHPSNQLQQPSTLPNKKHQLQAQQPSEATLPPNLGYNLHQTVVLQDPATNSYTIMKGDTAQTNIDQNDFLTKLELNGYSVDYDYDNNQPIFPGSSNILPHMFHQATNLLSSTDPSAITKHDEHLYVVDLPQHSQNHNQQSQSIHNHQHQQHIPSIHSPTNLMNDGVKNNMNTNNIHHGTLPIVDENDPPISFNLPKQLSLSTNSQSNKTDSLVESTISPGINNHTQPSQRYQNQSNKSQPIQSTNQNYHDLSLNQSKSDEFSIQPALNVDERLLMTSLSTFQRTVGLAMLFDPNTEITAFGEEAIVRYICTMYKLQTTPHNGTNSTNINVKTHTDIHL